MLARMLFTLAALGASAAIVDRLYRRYLRESVLTWGATPEEATAKLPGDQLLDPAATSSVREGEPMTFVWFGIWLIANIIGDSAPLQFDPVNFWAGALLLAVAIDLNRPRPELRHDKA